MLNDVRGTRQVPANFDALNAFEFLLCLDVIGDFHNGPRLAPLAGQDVGFHEPAPSPAIERIAYCGVGCVGGEVLRYGDAKPGSEMLEEE